MGGFPAFSVAGDLDHNGSPDVVIAAGTGVLVALNTFGNPPVLAQLSTSSTFVAGPATVTGTVSLGGPAPGGGATVTLASSNPAAKFPNGKTVVIPAGSQTATFAISAQAVTKSTPVAISGVYNSVKQSATLTIVPVPTVSSVSISPASLIGLFGGAPAAGTITLSAPAPDGTVVSLTSAASSVASVPASVTFAPGATTAAFTVTAQHVTADTPVIISATLQASTGSGTVTVRKETATITVTKAEYTVSKSQLKVEANSNDRVASLQVYNSITGALIGSIPLVNTGKFSGQLTATGTLNTVAVQSTVGGLAIATVTQK